MFFLIACGVMPCAVVVGLLLLAAAVGLGDGALHRAGDAVGIEDRRPSTLRAARPMVWISEVSRAQEAFLVGVEDGDQRAFGDIEPLAQQIDADQHVEGAQPQVADDLDPLQACRRRSACSARGCPARAYIR